MITLGWTCLFLAHFAVSRLFGASQNGVFPTLRTLTDPAPFVLDFLTHPGKIIGKDLSIDACA
jgi:hypothetical protein